MFQVTPEINSVSLVLLKGPSENAVDFSCIANDIPNSGTYAWTPSTDLVPYGDHNYGIKIISDKGGQFQFSTQFGISNPSLESSASPSASKTKTDEHKSYADSTSGTLTATSHNVHITTHVSSSYAVASSSSNHSSHSSHSQSHASKSSVLIHASSGFPTHSKNNTHVITSYHKTKTLASTGGVKNSTAFVKSTQHASKSTLAAITSVAIQTAATPPPQVPSSTTSVATSSPTAAAVRMVAGGILAGLGGLAALVL